MKSEGFPSFEAYFEAASETSKINLRDDPSGIVAEMKNCHAFYAEHLFSDHSRIESVAALVGIQAYYWLMAAAKLGMAGHASATFPLYRTALEAACYSFLMSQDSELSVIWMNRHRDDDSKKLCRKKFTSAVRTAASLINNKEFIGNGTDEWIMEGYNSAIDFGAHPNSKSIFHNVTIDEDYSATEVSVQITALHNASAIETKRGLLAFVDYSLLIGVILLAREEAAPDLALHKLQELQVAKDKLDASFV